MLGPLVVAAAVYESCGARSRLRHPDIRDSKEIYARGGRDALARGLGPYLGLKPPVTLTGVLRKLAVRPDPRGSYKWYGEVTDPVPEPGRCPAAFRSLHLNPVCEREFNAACDGPGGKAGLLFEETMRVLRHVLAAYPDVPAEVVCDKHGGRHRYAAYLMQALCPRNLLAERESPRASVYRLDLEGRPVRITFKPRADVEDGPTALASMAAKYLRELFMESFNAFFAEHIEGLRPTAGYYGDGRRFMEEVEGTLRRLGIESTALVRSR